MTEHPYQQSWLPQFYTPTSNYHHHQHQQNKRPFSNTNSFFNQTNNGGCGYTTPTQQYYNRNNQQQQNHHQQHISDYDGKQYFQNSIDDDELTEESIKNNVQIVLNNINRNYNKLKHFILNEKVNNNALNGGLNMISSPESDCNSNMGGPLGCSVASSHDFTHDNSDYQWFLDYG